MLRVDHNNPSGCFQHKTATDEKAGGKKNLLVTFRFNNTEPRWINN